MSVGRQALGLTATTTPPPPTPPRYKPATGAFLANIIGWVEGRVAGKGTDMGVHYITTFVDDMRTTRYITKFMEDMRTTRFEGAKSRRVKVLPIDIYRTGVVAVISKRKRCKACP